MSFQLTTTVASAAAPFCVGFAFRKGDIPSGQGVVANAANVQVSIKNRWTDGSAKFAVVAGVAAVGANTSLSIALSAGTPASAAALGLADLKATNAVASIGCGSFGTVNWSGSDWDSPFATWLTGPRMSSWIYRRPVGSDAHLVAWLEVRLYAGGQVEILPWIENGYLKVAGPTNKSATYTFSLGAGAATQRFSAAVNLPHHCRTALVSGTALSYWLGNDPQISARHDTAYLQATELVPTYRAAVSPSAGVVSALVTTYSPLQQGNFSYGGDSMAGGGYQEPIGLLPQHDVLYLCSTASKTYGAVIRNGFSAGRYPIHYRDETTNRPLRFSQYPRLGISDGSSFKDNGASYEYTPTISGTLPPSWDCAHSPSVGYMAYLLTGRWYFMEEVQFAATANHLGKGAVPALRDNAKGLVKTEVGAWQTRSMAWQWRTLVQALTITPDDDAALRDEFIASVQYNIDDLHGKYVAQANNPWGWVKPGEAYNVGLGDTIQFGAVWQQDFVTGAFGYALALGLPVSSTHASKLSQFFAWKAKSVVMRVGPSSGWWYINADPYVMTIASNSTPNYDNGTGPWHATEAAAYNATYAQTAPIWWGTTEGVLAGEIMPGDRAMWGNLMPALAYAVRFGVPGALDGYNRVIGATNWPALRDAFNVAPVWSVAPAAVP
jgi:hypothetical protein